MKRGFTLVELLVVIAMLMLLAGAITTSVSSAQRRAKIVQATTEAQEMTNAILAYENYGDLAEIAGKFSSPRPAAQSDMGFILGDEPLKDGNGKVPVLFNAPVRNNAIRDPWGKEYYVTVRKNQFQIANPDSTDSMRSNVTFPNFNRRTADK